MITRVSDHALLRWLERVEGIGVEGLRMRFGADMRDVDLRRIVERELAMDLSPVRNAIRDMLNAAGAPDEGVFDLDGKRFALSGGNVTTVITSLVSPARIRADRRAARKRQRATIFMRGRRVAFEPGEDGWL